MDLAALYSDIVETSPDGIWVFDLDGHTLYTNPRLAEILGVPPATMASRSVLDTLHEDDRRHLVDHLASLRAGQVDHHETEARLLRPDGSPLWVLVRESVRRTADGQVSEVVHRISDYTARREMLEDLRSSRAQLAEAHEIARIGSWTWDVVRDHISGSPEIYRLYDLDDATFPEHYPDFLEMVHPDDRDLVDGAVRAALDGADDFVWVARIRGGGDWLWTRGRGIVHRDADGTAVGMSGTHQDITEARQVELELIDLVNQNRIMQAVASAANEARTLNEVLTQARGLVLLHDDWERARGFVPDDARDGVVPLYVTEEDRTSDLDTPDLNAVELEVANRAFHRRGCVWDSSRLTIGFPISYDDEVQAVVTITSAPPLYRHEMIETMVQAVAVQLARVAERERSERELADARDQAMAASRQKSDFLATMSHEIRTPLNGVIGLNDLLLRTALDPGQLRLASGVQVASRALLAVLNDILDFSKIEAGRLELERVDFQVRRVLDQVLSVMSESAREKSVVLDASCHPDVPETVSGDPTRFAQVLTNLVSNAIKFTESGEVHVQATAEDVDGGTRLRVEVSDTGLGVEDAQVEGLFDPFTQADASTTRLYGGTGLGLAISKQIAEALDGEIGYRPNQPAGSVFWFTGVFGRRTGSSAGSDDKTVRTPLGARSEDAGVVAALAEPNAAATVRAQLVPRRRILVVEDNVVNQMVALGLLESLGYAAETAGDGLHALQALDAGDFDAVLMDVQMPRMDGYAATREIRARAQGARRIPVIAMTAAAVEGERERCLAAGMDDFLTKPVDPAALAAVLTTWLKSDDRPAHHPSTEATTTMDHLLDYSEPDPDALDTDRLDMLRDLDEDNTDYLDRAIGNFLTNSHTGLDTIREAVAAGDAAALRAAAHKLAGSALNLGVTYAGEALRSLEFLGDEGTVEGAEDKLVVAETALARGRDELLAYQASYSSGRRPGDPAP
jgi:PAS domain S-box-containing protein